MRIGMNDEYRDLLALVSRYVQKKQLRPLANETDAREYECFYQLDQNVLEYWQDGFSRTYPVREIKLCRSYASGLFLVFRDKRFLILPVTGDSEANTELALITQLLYQAMPLRFDDSERLYFPETEEQPEEQAMDDPKGWRDKQRSRKKNGRRHGIYVAADAAHAVSRFPILIFIVVLLAMIPATVFVRMPARDKPLAREELETVTGRLAKWTFESKYDSVTLSDGVEYEIPYIAVTGETEDKLKSVPAGAEIMLLLSPDSGCAVGVEQGEKILLDANAVQKKVHRESVAFMVMGVIIYAASPFLVAYGIAQIVLEKRHRPGRQNAGKNFRSRKDDSEERP